jgi:cell division protein FtsW (lipid II flippase)
MKKQYKYQIIGLLTSLILFAVLVSLFPKETLQKSHATIAISSSIPFLIFMIIGDEVDDAQRKD